MPHYGRLVDTARWRSVSARMLLLALGVPHPPYLSPKVSETKGLFSKVFRMVWFGAKVLETKRQELREVCTGWAWRITDSFCTYLNDTVWSITTMPTIYCVKRRVAVGVSSVFGRAGA
jgi:hypothetical protein